MTELVYVVFMGLTVMGVGCLAAFIIGYYVGWRERETYEPMTPNEKAAKDIADDLGDYIDGGL